MPWRLGHIVDFLTEQRNAVWLGLPGTGTERDGAPDTEETLAAPIGKPAGCTCSTN